MPAMPKVSVIIPVYNVEQYIERCARSLFEQTLDDMEYIFVDDCSKDNSIKKLEAILTDYPAREGQTKIIRMSENKGQAIATHKALSVAKGEYIIRCDSDDEVNIDTYERLYLKAASEHLEVVIFDKILVSDNKTKVVESFKHNNETDYRSELMRNILILYGIPSLCSAFIAKKVFQNEIFYPTGKMGEDVALLLQLVYYSKSVGYLNVPFYRYYRNPGSTCNSVGKEAILERYKDLCDNTELMRKFLQKKGLYKNYRKLFDVSENAARNQLFALLDDPKIFNLWKNTFPGINKRMLFNKYFSFSDIKASYSKYIKYSIKHKFAIFRHE